MQAALALHDAPSLFNNLAKVYFLYPSYLMLAVEKSWSLDGLP
jgi:hypothetical protein